MESYRFPDAEDVVAGQRFYVWETEDSGSVPRNWSLLPSGVGSTRTRARP